MKITTIRISDELNEKLVAYAKEKDLSKNQVMKIALRELLQQYHNTIICPLE